jgi:hypothetical protein
MLARLRAHLTYANVVSTIALCLVVGGGSALAANTIFSSDIVDGEVKNDDLAANAVGSAKIADRAVKNADLSIGASSSNTIADGGIQGVDVKGDTLTGTQINESSLSGVDADTLDGKDSTEFLTASPLASGETLTGIWATNAPGSATTPGRGMAPIAFRPELAVDLPLGSAHYLAGGSTSSQCPGAGQAAAGHLCVYEGFIFGASFMDFANPGDGGAGDSVRKEGTILRLVGTDPLGQARGTWAVTAP